MLGLAVLTAAPGRAGLFESQDLPALATAAVPEPEKPVLKIGDRPTLLKDEPQPGHSVCDLHPRMSLELAKAPDFVHGSYVFIKLAVRPPGCAAKEGYVYVPHVAPESLGAGVRICEKFWEEAPGTADYTTWDSFHGRAERYADRSEGETLLGNPNYRVLDRCSRAVALRPCFDKVVNQSSLPEALQLRRWALDRGLDAVRLFMAIAVQETDLGTLRDTCAYGTCNGIGMVQVITAITPDGSRLDAGDSRWRGITHNVLTNLGYGLRVLATDTSASSDLWTLAYHYNGSQTARSYADAVLGHYARLGRCGF